MSTTTFQVPGRYLQIPACLLPDTRISPNAKLAYAVALAVARVRGTMPYALVTNREIAQALGVSEDTAARLVRELAGVGLVKRPDGNSGVGRSLWLAIDHEGKLTAGDAEPPAINLRKNAGGSSPDPLQKRRGTPCKNADNEGSTPCKNAGGHPIKQISNPERAEQPRVRDGGGRTEEHPAVAAVRDAVAGEPDASEIVEAVKGQVEPGDDPAAVVALVRESKTKARHGRGNWLATVIPARRREGKLFRVVRQEPPPEPPPTPEELERRKKATYGVGIGKGMRTHHLAAGGAR